MLKQPSLAHFEGILQESLTAQAMVHSGQVKLNS